MAFVAMRVLVIDVGGTHVKCLGTGHRRARKFASGKALTATRMVRGVLRITRDWRYDVVSIGYPGPVLHGRPAREPHNLGSGWVGFDFGRAFERPVIVINDAAMQALGSYDGGSMLFLGLGTGLGSALIIDGVVEAMELAHLPYKNGRTYEDYLGKRGLRRLGKKKWRRHVGDVVARLRAAFAPERVVLGGGNARLLKRLPPGVRIVGNASAFTGGTRLWDRRRPARGVRDRAGAARSERCPRLDAPRHSHTRGEAHGARAPQPGRAVSENVSGR